MEAQEQVDAVFPALVDLIKGVKPEQHGNQTPCEGWTVRDLLNHLVGGAYMFAGAFGSAEAAPAPSGAASDVIGDADPASAFQGAGGAFAAAIAVPGAQQKMVTLPFGQMPGEAVVRLAAADLLIHGWDLAQATGQNWTPSDELAQEALGFERQAIQPGLRGPGMPFGPEVAAPAGASAFQQLIAFSGRQP